MYFRKYTRTHPTLTCSPVVVTFMFYDHFIKMALQPQTGILKLLCKVRGNLFDMNGIYVRLYSQNVEENF